MKLGYIIVYVDNVVETLDFYKRVFDCSQKFLHESKEYGELDTGETILAFASNDMAKHNGFEIRENKKYEAPVGAEVVFVVDDVAGSFNRAVERGAFSLVEPKEMPWGQMVSYVRDNNGFLVEICSPIS